MFRGMLSFSMEKIFFILFILLSAECMVLLYKLCSYSIYRSYPQSLLWFSVVKWSQQLTSGSDPVVVVGLGLFKLIYIKPLVLDVPCPFQ